MPAPPNRDRPGHRPRPRSPARRCCRAPSAPAAIRSRCSVLPPSSHLRYSGPFSLTCLFAPSDDRTTSLRTSAPAQATRCLSLSRSAVENFRPDLAHSVTQAYAQQGLARILKDVNHLALRVLQVDALA